MWLFTCAHAYARARACVCMRAGAPAAHVHARPSPLFAGLGDGMDVLEHLSVCAVPVQRPRPHAHAHEHANAHNPARSLSVSAPESSSLVHGLVIKKNVCHKHMRAHISNPRSGRLWRARVCYVCAQMCVRACAIVKYARATRAHAHTHTLTQTASAGADRVPAQHRPSQQHRRHAHTGRAGGIV